MLLIKKLRLLYGCSGSVRRGVFRVEDTRTDEVDVMWRAPFDGLVDGLQYNSYVVLMTR